MNSEQPSVASEQLTPATESVASTTKKRLGLKKLAIILVAFLILTGSVVAAYLLFFKPQTAQSLYREAVENALSTSGEAHLTFDLDSGRMQYKGIIFGNIDSDDFRLRADINAQPLMEGLPMRIAAEAIVFQKGDESEAYMRIKTMTSTITGIKEYMESYSAPIVNKWVKADTDEEEENKPTNFENDGPAAALVPLGVFGPVTQFSDTDKTTWLAAADRHNLYQVADEIGRTTFKGVDVRKLEISIEKEAFKAFEKEIDEKLSDEANNELLEEEFIDQLFGRDDKLVANVYLDPETATIVGVDFEASLREVVEESEFNTKISAIKGSVLYEYKREATIEAPKEFISEAEYDALLEGLSEE